MTPLRQAMIDAMQLRGFSPCTHRSYLAAVTDLARYCKRSPEQVSVEEIQAYFLYLVKERGLAWASCRLSLNAIRFLYIQVLQQPFDVPIAHPKRKQQIPELLTRSEVGWILAICSNPKHRMMLTTCYGCGLRVNELVALKVRHIDGERRLLRVEQGKGGKDRAVALSEKLLLHLRQYWRQYHPHDWFFPSSHHFPQEHLSASSIQRVFKVCKRKAGIEKRGGIHSLRHAYATHQLEGGMPIHLLQRQLGHQNINSTLRYAHWVPNYRQGKEVWCDLIADLEVDHAEQQ